MYILTRFGLRFAYYICALELVLWTQCITSLLPPSDFQLRVVVPMRHRRLNVLPQFIFLRLFLWAECQRDIYADVTVTVASGSLSLRLITAAATCPAFSRSDCVVKLALTTHCLQ